MHHVGREPISFGTCRDIALRGRCLSGINTPLVAGFFMGGRKDGEHAEPLQEKHAMELIPKELIAIALALAVTVGVICAFKLRQ